MMVQSPHLSYVFTAINVDRSDDPCRFVIAAAFAVALARKARVPMIGDDLQRWIKTDVYNETTGIAELAVDDFVSQLKAPGAGGPLEQAIALFLKRAHTLWEETAWERQP